MISFIFSGHMAIHKPKTACDFCGKLVSRMKEHLETMHKEDSEMRFRCELGIKIFYKNNFLDELLSFCQLLCGEFQV